MASIKFSRYLTVEPEDEDLTLSTLEAFVRSARELEFGDDARVSVFPVGHYKFSISVTER